MINCYEKLESIQTNNIFLTIFKKSKKNNISKKFQKYIPIR